MLAMVLPALLASNYAISTAQLQQTRIALTARSANRFGTPTEAAYAASIRYRTALAGGEIGAKIYLDSSPDGVFWYSYGPRIYSEVDPENASDEIVYDDRETDGHAAVVGMWHEHAIGSTWADLYGHYDVIRETHQTIWTTVDHDFYVQFFDGMTVQPLWTSAVPAIAPLCTACD